MHKASLHILSGDRTQQIRSQLLSWYAESARDLPWRLPAVTYGETDYDAYVARLYRCLLSETMLQQTQVKTVMAYYVKWLERFPSIQDLARADEEQVMACWAGLGYYSRAKRLQQAAQYLVANFISKRLEFPQEAEYWIKHVPGVGPYTAGAILSISFAIPSAIVDGNVQRVLSRVLAIHGDTSTPKSAGSKLVWQSAAQLVCGDQPGNLNQSMMELGATVCTPSQPSCLACPIRHECTAYAQMSKLKSQSSNLWASNKSVKKESTAAEITDMEDMCSVCPATIDPMLVQDKMSTYIQSLYPFKPQKKKQREETAIILVIRDDGGSSGDAVYLEKKAKGLLAGLYDFPTILLDADDAAGACDSLIAKHERKFDARNLGTTLHLFTHIRRTSHVLVCERVKASRALEAFAQENGTGKWVQVDGLADVGVSELCLKNWRLASGAVKMRKRPVTGDEGGSSNHKRRQLVKNKLARAESRGKDDESPGTSKTEETSKISQSSKLVHASKIECKQDVKAGAHGKVQSTLLSMLSRPRTRVQ